MLSTIRAAPEVEAAGVVVDIFRLGRVDLDYGVRLLPEKILDPAHHFP